VRGQRCLGDQAAHGRRGTQAAWPLYRKAHVPILPRPQSSCLAGI
jgi:hypothetical protein